MNAEAILTLRENEVAGYLAWGDATKKDIAEKMFISVRTVENHARSIYEKVGCKNVAGLSAWWFCTNFNISFDLSPMKRAAATVIAVLLLSFAEFATDVKFVRVGHRQPVMRVRMYRGGKREEEYNNLINNII